MNSAKRRRHHRNDQAAFRDSVSYCCEHVDERLAAGAAVVCLRKIDPLVLVEAQEFREVRLVQRQLALGVAFSTRSALDDTLYDALDTGIVLRRVRNH